LPRCRENRAKLTATGFVCAAHWFTFLLVAGGLFILNFIWKIFKPDAVRAAAQSPVI
jgi:hypothetical protein